MRITDERGQGLAEYVIIVVVVAVVVIVALRIWGGSILGQFQNATSEIDSAGSEGLSGDLSRDGSGKAQGDQVALEDSGRQLSGKGSSEGGIRQSSGDLAKEVHALRPAGIGDDEEVIGSFQLGLGPLIVIGVFMTGFGVAIVFMATKDQRKEKKAKKKEKKGEKKKKSKFANLFSSKGKSE